VVEIVAPGPKRSPRAVRLSARRQEALALYGKGRTYYAVAREMAVTLATAQEYIRVARKERRSAG
jgi:DNA-binding NarL/FixJ family response regulator